MKFALKIKNLYGSYSYRKYEYEVHQVGLKDFGSQNFRVLAFKGEAVGFAQIFYHNGDGA
jgi:hypothetical protein